MTDASMERGKEAVQKPKPGDVIQTGYMIQGCDEIQWGSHQIVDWVSSDGTPVYRPREAKVDKYAAIWRFPVETPEKIRKDLRHWANPKAAREYLKREEKHVAE